MKSMPFWGWFWKGSLIMEIKKLWKEAWKKTPEFAAVVSALTYGLLVHLFALTNLLHNHDNIASQPGGYGIGAPLGRWFLEILGRFCDKAGLNYNLPSVNGLAYILLLAAGAAFLVSALGIRSRLSAVLAGALFVAFPTVSATMIYRFTAVFYGIAALLAVMAPWILRRFRWGLAASAGLLALSMGIYQAYAPLTISLFVLQLICDGLRGETDVKTLVCRGLYDCLALILGLGLYFAGMHLCVAVFDMPLMEYQGVSTMGSLSLSQLPRLVVNALRASCLLPLRDYLGLANRALMRIAYLLLAVTTVLLVARILVKRVRNIGTSVIICLLWVAFLLAVGFIEVMVPDGNLHTLMTYSFCLLACAPLAVLECIPEGDRRNLYEKCCTGAASLLVAVLVLFYGYYGNVNYVAAHLAGEQVSNYLNRVVAQATMTEGYTTDKKWALIGEIQDPLLGGPWNDEITYPVYGFTEFLLNEYSRNDWIKNYIGYDVPRADQQTLEALAASDAVRAMPCYPNAGSIAIIGDMVVVKFGN